MGLHLYSCPRLCKYLRHVCLCAKLSGGNVWSIGHNLLPSSSNLECRVRQTTVGIVALGPSLGAPVSFKFLENHEWRGLRAVIVQGLSLS